MKFLWKGSLWYLVSETSCPVQCYTTWNLISLKIPFPQTVAIQNTSIPHHCRCLIWTKAHLAWAAWQLRHRCSRWQFRLWLLNIFNRLLLNWLHRYPRATPFLEPPEQCQTHHKESCQWTNGSTDYGGFGKPGTLWSSDTELDLVNLRDDWRCRWNRFLCCGFPKYWCLCRITSKAWWLQRLSNKVSWFRCSWYWYARIYRCAYICCWACFCCCAYFCCARFCRSCIYRWWWYQRVYGERRCFRGCSRDTCFSGNLRTGYCERFSWDDHAGFRDQFDGNARFGGLGDLRGAWRGDKTGISSAAEKLSGFVYRNTVALLTADNKHLRIPAQQTPASRRKSTQLDMPWRSLRRHNSPFRHPGCIR